jgi:hypothetical protein
MMAVSFRVGLPKPYGKINRVFASQPCAGCGTKIERSDFMQDSIPTETVKDWLVELRLVAEPKRYKGQKAKLVGKINTFLLAANTYKEPGLWQRAKNRTIAIFSMIAG